jgi:hypothetical protein
MGKTARHTLSIIRRAAPNYLPLAKLVIPAQAGICMMAADPDLVGTSLRSAADRRLPTADCRPPTVNCELRTADCELKTTFQSPAPTVQSKPLNSLLTCNKFILVFNAISIENQYQ